MSIQMQPDPYITVEKYLELDLKADGSAAQNGVTKYEYHDGQVYAMAGETLEHALITDNVAQAIRSRLSMEDCRVLTSAMRTQVGSDFTYPDVLVFCGQADLTDSRPPSVKNPILLAEVLSESTRHRDKDWKLEAYWQIPTLRECWLLEQKERHVLRYLRTDTKWGLDILSGEDEELMSNHFKFTIPISEFYRGLEL